MPQKYSFRQRFVASVIGSVIILGTLTWLSVAVAQTILNVHAGLTSLHLFHWTAGIASFSVGCMLLSQALALWQMKRIRDLRAYGPNYWSYAGWALSLAGLLYLAGLAKWPLFPLPNEWMLFSSLASISLIVVFLTLGLELLLFMVLGNSAELVEWLFPALKEPQFTNYDLTETILKNIQNKKIPDGISWDTACIASYNWSTEDGLLRMILHWEKQEENPLREESAQSGEENAGNNTVTVRYSYQVTADASGKVLELSRRKPDDYK